MDQKQKKVAAAATPDGLSAQVRIPGYAIYIHSWITGSQNGFQKIAIYHIYWLLI